MSTYEMDRSRARGIMPKEGPQGWEIRDGVAIIRVTRRSGEVIVGVADAADVSILGTSRWFVSGHPGRLYLLTIRQGKPVEMGHVLLGLDSGIIVDHRNGDTLDNRRANLRVATPGMNQQNTFRPGRARGVYPNGRGSSGWRVRVFHAGRRYNLSGFATEQEAVAAASALRAQLLPFSNEQRSGASIP